MTPSGNHIAGLDAEYVEEKIVGLITTRRTKKHSQKWVVKKRGFQVGELDQLKLKVIAFHDDRDEEIHMTQLVRRCYRFGFSW